MSKNLSVMHGQDAGFGTEVKGLQEMQYQAGMGTYKGNRAYSTGYSSLNGGVLSMDPSIRKMQNEALQRNAALYGDVGKASADYIGRLGGLRSQYEGNNAGYIQARVNPILQQSALRKGELQRSHGMRNMGGSSFANQDFNNLAIDTSRAEGDARALGTRENLDTVRGLEGDIYGATRDRIATQMEMNGVSLEVAKTRLAGELQALGLSKDQIQQEMDAFENMQKRRNSTNQSIGESVAGMFSLGGGGGGG